MFSFVVGVLVGLATPFSEPHIRKALENIILDDITMSDGEFQNFCFSVMLVLGGILVLIAGGGMPLAMALGGFLGLFGKRLYNTLRNTGGPGL